MKWDSLMCRYTFLTSQTEDEWWCLRSAHGLWQTMHVPGQTSLSFFVFLHVCQCEIHGYVCVCVCATRLVFQHGPHQTLSDYFPYLPYLGNWLALHSNYLSMRSLGLAVFWWLSCGPLTEGRITNATHEKTFITGRESRAKWVTKSFNSVSPSW